MAKKRLQKWLAFCLAVSMLMGTTAMAADSETINNPDGTVTIKTTQTKSSEKEDGNTLVVVEIEKKTDGTTNKGVKVDRDEKRTESTVKNENGKKLDYHWVEEGTDIRDWATPEDETDPSVTVDLIPGKQTEASASETTVSGDVQQGEDDKEYDYTKTTEYDRTVTATTGEVRTEIHDADTGLVGEKNTVLKPLKPVYDETDVPYSSKNEVGTGKKGVFDRNYLSGQKLDCLTLENGIKIWLNDYDHLISNIYVPEGVEVPEDFNYTVGMKVSDWINGKNRPAGSTYKNDVAVHNINNWYDKDGNMIFSEDGEFMYVGTGEHSKYFAGIVKVIYQKQPVLDENGEAVLDENGNPVMEVVTDENGNPVIEKLVNNVNGTDHTSGGELLDEIVPEYAIDGGFSGSRAQNFMLMDKNGNRVYAYCCDVQTGTAEGVWYNVSNLEDSDYYTPEAENHIRSIVMNGYWGTSDVQKEDGTYETGSLEGIKAKLLAAVENGEIERYVKVPVRDTSDAGAGKIQVDENGEPIYQDEEMDLMEIISGMTEGEALLATQAAIWSFANGSEGATSGIDGPIVVTPDWYRNHQLAYGKIEKEPLDDEGGVRVAALYSWLMNLDTDESMDVVVNEQNFVKDVSLTVYDKSADHENNFDNDDANDVYDTELNFKLAFVPGDNDDLLVQISYTDLDGKPVNVVRRLAGENEEGQSYETIEPELDGSYIVEGLKLSENEDFNFDLRLEGTQYLEKGVYVYAPVGGRDVSQTFVGVAEGERNVDVSMGMTIRFDVDEDNHIRAERHWREEGPDLEPGDDDIIPPTGDDDDDTPKGDDDDDDTTIGDDDVPKDEFPGDDDDTDEIPEEDTPKAEIPAEDIPEEDVPLADVPKTGDVSALWFALSALSGAGLVGLNLTGKKREDEE
ncbi:MAG: Cys-Gln thioester bond-forming surface protein [Butyricicoccus sp.]|nr:Cys-Gln thioester bond-forming surface protein [Butyricicoccus sp.]